MTENPKSESADSVPTGADEGNFSDSQSSSPSGGNNSGNSESGQDSNEAPPPTPTSPSDSGEADSAGEPETEPTETTEEGPNWFQLSTDDSTSMASAQMFKGNIWGQALKHHEFINYYDPPAGLRDQEEWGIDGTVETIHYSLKIDNFTHEVMGNCDEPTDPVDQPETDPESDMDGESETPDPVDEENCVETESRNIAEVLFHMNTPTVDQETRRNWNVFLCVDVSGSMSGSKMAFTRDALSQMLTHFKEGDKLTLITFDSNSHDVFIDLEYSSNESEIRAAFAGLNAGSSTNMIAGLERTYQLAQNNFDETMLQRVLLFSDGAANVGDTDIATFSDLTRMNGQEGIYLSGIGVGQNYDWERMDRLTDAGKGAHVFLPNSQEVDLIFGDYFPKLVEVAADRIAIEMTLPQGITLESFSGEEVSTNPEERLQNIILAAGDDITFLARFQIHREEALTEPVQFVLKLRPLSTAEEVVETIDIEHFSDLIKNPGALLSRTRLVNDFAKLATGAGYPQVTPEQLDDALSGQTASDWGLAEIQYLVQTRF